MESQKQGEESTQPFSHSVMVMESLKQEQEIHTAEDNQKLPPSESLETEASSFSAEEPPSLEEVEIILNYSFKDKKLLEEALTHSSCSSEDQNKCFSYERLEYVGDAVLNLLITKEQYFLYPNYAPGPLTRLRAANVDTEKLARVAVKHRLHRFLRHKMPMLEEQIREFKKGTLEYPLHSNGLIDVPKALADIVESLIGAVFIDCGANIDTVWKVFKGLLEPKIDPDTIKKHPVTELYEVCQKNHLNVKFIDLWKERTVVDVFINDRQVGRGTYGPKKEIAHNRAAKNALDNMTRTLDSTDNIYNEDGYEAIV